MNRVAPGPDSEAKGLSQIAEEVDDRPQPEVSSGATERAGGSATAEVSRPLSPDLPGHCSCC